MIKRWKYNNEPNDSFAQAISTALAGAAIERMPGGAEVPEPLAMTQAPPAALPRSRRRGTAGGRDGGAIQTAGQWDGGQPRLPTNAAATGTAATGTTGAQAADAGEWKVAQPQDAMLKGKWLGDLQGRRAERAGRRSWRSTTRRSSSYFANFMEARDAGGGGALATVSHGGARGRRTRGRRPRAGTRGVRAQPGNKTQSDLNPRLPVGPVPWEPDLWGRGAQPDPRAASTTRR